MGFWFCSVSAPGPLHGTIWTWFLFGLSGSDLTQFLLIHSSSCFVSVVLPVVPVKVAPPTERAPSPLSRVDLKTFLVSVNRSVLVDDHKYLVVMNPNHLLSAGRHVSYRLSLCGHGQLQGRPKEQDVSLRSGSSGWSGITSGFFSLGSWLVSRMKLRCFFTV